VERRFDPAVAGYLAALTAGTVGVAVGVAMAVGRATVDLRAAHVTLNLLGLVGLVVGGTLPFSVPPSLGPAWRGTRPPRGCSVPSPGRPQPSPPRSSAS
jgi:hypothetical protein